MKDMRKKQELSSLLYLKWSTSRYIHICESKYSLQRIVYTILSPGHGYAGIEKPIIITNIPKPLALKTVIIQCQKW